MQQEIVSIGFQHTSLSSYSNFEELMEYSYFIIFYKFFHFYSNSTI